MIRYLKYQKVWITLKSEVGKLKPCNKIKKLASLLIAASTAVSFDGGFVINLFIYLVK